MTRATFAAALLGLIASIATPVAVRAAEEPAAYIQRMLGEMVAVSKKPTAERRAYYIQLLSEEIDWTVPAVRALGQRFEALVPSDRQKLANWSRDSVLGTNSVMEFAQNLILQSCKVADRNLEGDRGSFRVTCARFGGEPPFAARFDLAPRDGRLKIVDIGYVGVSLSEELAKEIVKPEAATEHGVKLN